MIIAVFSDSLIDEEGWSSPLSRQLDMHAHAYDACMHKRRQQQRAKNVGQAADFPSKAQWNVL